MYSYFRLVMVVLHERVICERKAVFLGEPMGHPEVELQSYSELVDTPYPKFKTAGISVQLKLSLAGVMVNLCAEDKKEFANRQIANYFLLTMGAGLTHCEGPVEDGMVHINHTFSPIDETYHDELSLKGQPRTDEMRNSGINYNMVLN